MATIKMPAVTEMEKTVLGAALVDEESSSLVVNSLNPNDFTQQGNRLVFESMKRLSDAKRAIDVETVTADMTAAHTFQDAGGSDFLFELVQSCISPSSTSYYAKEIRNTSVLRGYLKTIIDVLGKYQSGAQTSPLTFIAETKPLIDDAASQGAMSGFEKAGDVAEQVVDQIAAQKNSPKKGLSGLDTGFSDLNKLTHGWHPGDFIIIGGRPSMGKTSFAINTAYYGAKTGATVGFFSLEMSSVQIMGKLISVISKVSSDRIKSGMVSEGEMAKILAAKKESDGLQLFFDDKSSGLLGDVIGDSDRLKVASKGLGLVVVDYIQLMKLGRKTENRQTEVADISRSLKQLARTLNVPVIALAQLNRDSEGNEGARPTMSNLKESGSLEQDADVVILLHRQSYYERRKNGDNEAAVTTCEVIVDKNRNGETGTVGLTFSRDLSRFDNFSSIQPSGQQNSRPINMEDGDDE